MIYEAEKGMSLNQAAGMAVRMNCDKLVLHDRIYKVSCEVKEVGRVIATEPEEP